jgi:rhodanese-related sulfurtransferase
MKIIIILLFLIGFNTFAHTQLVENKSFNVMLKTLLSHNVKELGVKEESIDSNTLFLDAREYLEYNVSHLKNSVWVGYNDFEISRVKNIAKNKKIVVYCSVGYRSEKITEKLIKAGYTNIFNMVGGIFEWKNQNNIVVDNTGSETQKIHAYSKTWGVWLNKGIKVYK